MDTSRRNLMIFIQALLKPQVEEFVISENLRETVTKLLESRLSKPTVRSYFTFNIYKYIVHTAEAEKQPFHKLSQRNAQIDLPFIIETVMTIMYLDNQILDKKQDVTDCSKEMKRNLLGANLLRYQIPKYIKSHFAPKEAQIVQEYVQEMFYCVDIGQCFDADQNYELFFEGIGELPSKNLKSAKLIRLRPIRNTMKRIEKEYGINKKDVKAYFERNYLISSSPFKLTSEMIMKLMKYEGSEKERILSFSETYGIVMQLVNDTSDFVYEVKTGSKKSGDVLSDLKNGIITLPMLLHFENCTEKSKVLKYLNTLKRKTLIGKHNQILKEMVISQALPDAIKIGKEIAYRCKSFLDRKNPLYTQLENMLSIAEINKYYYHIFRAKRFYKSAKNKDKLYRCEKRSSSRKNKDNGNGNGKLSSELDSMYSDSFYYENSVKSNVHETSYAFS